LEILLQRKGNITKRKEKRERERVEVVTGKVK